ncbi:class I SAM-dependent methyltransferase [Halobaculum sp. MBLA0147]|uniref:class I SAM-dependent methyltransferase n=1 Tax=Halobaculum sp. MBLA0147 TaxID=3079934 RepID=UPI003524F1C1
MGTTVTGSDASDRYEIDDVAFLGRTFAEYRRMLGLEAVELSGRRVLDCPGGACGFTAGARARGADAYAVDPVYGPPVEHVADRARRDLHRAVDALDEVEHLYVWDVYDDPADLASHRWSALGRFLADYADHGDRYLPAALPRLPFPDDTFDLVCSAHLLFLYADHFDHEFHVRALRELCRVARGEVRLFPLVDLATERYDGLDDLLLWLERAGHDPTVRPVDFEFQRGADECLVIDAATG